MSEERAPYNYQSAMGDTLRRAADETNPEERARLTKLFASYLETALDQAAGRTQTTLWGAEERLRDQIGDLRSMIEALGGHVQEQRAEQRGQAEQIAAGQEGIRVDLANQVVAIGGLHTQVSVLQQLFQGISETVDQVVSDVRQLHEALSAQRERADTRIAALAREHEQIRGQVGTLAEELRTLREDEVLGWLRTHRAALADVLLWWAQQAV